MFTYITLLKFVQVLLKIYGMGSEFFRKKLEVRLASVVYKEMTTIKHITTTLLTNLKSVQHFDFHRHYYTRVRATLCQTATILFVYYYNR